MIFKILNFYIIRQIIGPFSLGLAILLMVLSLERLLRLMQITTDHNAPSFKVFEFLFYLLPHYLGLALPAALFLGILLAVRRLRESSELVIIQSIGISPRILYKSMAIVVIPATLLMLLLTGYAQPHGRYAYRVALHELVADNPLVGLHPGVFFELDENTILRAEKINKADGVLESIFIAHQETNSPEQLVIGAPRARIIRDTDTQASILKLENGNLIRENKEKQKLSKLSFQSYSWRFPGTLGEPYGPRGQDEREMTFGELITGSISGIQPKSTPLQITTELHIRLIQVLSLSFLALWAVPLALIGTGRTSKAGGIILGAGLFVFYEKLLGLGEAYAAQGALPIWLALWVPFLALGIGGWLFMRIKMPENIKHKTKGRKVALS